MMRKRVWDVLHISEENRVPIVKGKTPLPLANITSSSYALIVQGQCTWGTTDSGIWNNGSVPWVVQRGQEYYQPHGPHMEGKYMNASQLASVCVALTTEQERKWRGEEEDKENERAGGNHNSNSNNSDTNTINPNNVKKKQKSK